MQLFIMLRLKKTPTTTKQLGLDGMNDRLLRYLGTPETSILVNKATATDKVSNRKFKYK